MKDFILSGSGGQGLILAGIILAEGAVLDNKHAIQTQSYGPEARGGASRAEIIISEEEINYPKVDHADYLLSLTTDAYKKYIKSLKNEGILIVDKGVKLEDMNGIRYVQLPILETAEKLGRIMVANIVALGAICAITEIMSKESLENAIVNRVPKGTEDLNIKAFNEGFQLGKEKKDAIYGEVC